MSEISLEQLKIFANDTINSIEVSQCLKNAKKIYESFGGGIFSGDAMFYNFETKEITMHGHQWNVLGLHNNNFQIIDIVNYLEKKNGIYFGYVGTEITIDILDNKIATHEECKNSLKNNCQSAKR